MGKKLVLAEKPSVGRELSRVLGANNKHNGYQEGNNYIVTWALGHLVTLADPEHYGEQYKTWSMETLPMLPEKMDLVVIKETSKQFRTVREQLSRKDVDELIIATDAGREGELVARWIIAKTGFRKPIKRLWISSQTDKAIREGFQKLAPGKNHENLYQSAVSRAQADWLVGLNVTRALTCKYNAQLSAGRVQTPTLAMIVAREEEIRRFRSKPYYKLYAEALGIKLLWQSSKNRTSQFSDKAEAEAMLAKLRQKPAKVVKVEKTRKREEAPLLYDLTLLQRDANQRYGMSAKDTLNAMQRLYEEHKVLTYPRTDSNHLSSDLVASLPERLRNITAAPYREVAMEIVKKGIRTSKRIVDDAKVSDHHAIIPTEERANWSCFSSDERKIYELVLKRFLAVFMGAYEYEQTTVTVQIGGETLTAKGKVPKEPGWKKVYQGLELFDDEDGQEDDERDQELPALKAGDGLAINRLYLYEGQTKPPARYTEGTLLGAMEKPGKFVTDERIRQSLADSGGIGTPATRADIIEKLYSAFYMEKRGKELVPTSKGTQLIALVPDELKSPELTGKWEQQLSDIATGKKAAVAFNKQIQDYTKKLVSEVKQSSKSYTHDNLTRTKCPQCGNYMLEVKNKKGKLLVCQDRACNYRENLAMQSNLRCPTCRKRLEVVGQGEKKLYTCQCGFRERFDRFNEKLRANKDKMSKQDVNRYMQKQKKETELGAGVFAEALKKAMEEKNG